MRDIKNIMNNTLIKSKEEKCFNIFVYGGLIGGLLFIILYGFKILNPSYLDWTYQGGDLVQHQLGWEAFRNSRWNFPIGLHDGLIYPNKISVIYTDSIPIFAIIFKCFSSVLPINFQYMGIYGLLCFILHGGFSALLVHKFINNIFISLISVPLFIYNSVLIYRMFAHTALASQWIILAAWCIWIYKDRFMSYKKLVLLWSILMFLAPCIHMYFVPMLGLMLLFFCMFYYYQTKKLRHALMIFIVPCILAILVIYVLGAFYNMGGDTLGLDCDIFTVNLNNFINPISVDHSGRVSLFLKPLQAHFGAYEGRCYLGLGLIISLIYIVFYNIYSYIKHHDKKSYISLHPMRFFILLVCIVLFILSLGLTVRLGATSAVTKIWYPMFIIKILSIYRCLGRFIWPVYYMIFLYVIKKYKEIMKSKINFIICITLLVLINILDHSGMLIDYHKYYVSDFKYESLLTDPIWDKIKKNKNHIMLMDDMTIDDVLIDNCLKIGKDLIKNGNTLNKFYLARYPEETINKNTIEVEKGLLNSHLDDNMICIYKENRENDIFTQFEENFDVYYANGYIIVCNKGYL